MIHSPLVSVIIPTYNRKDSLCRTLDSLTRQTFPVNRFEVIVVDDGSDEEYASILYNDWPYSLRLLRRPHEGGTAAKNAGAQASYGELLLFLDDDIRVTPHCIAAFVEAHAQFDKAIVTGHLIPVSVNKDSPFGNTQTQRVEPDGHNERLSPISFAECLGGFFSVKRDHFFALGMLEGVGDGWPNWEDVYFGYKAYRAKFVCVRAWDAVGYHFDVALSDLDSSKSRWFRASKVVPLLFKKHPEVKHHLPMFHDKTPIAWGQDPPRLIARKLARHIASSRPALWGLEQLVRVLEQRYPSPALLRPLYRWVIGGYIFRGYRDGLREYGPVSGRNTESQWKSV